MEHHALTFLEEASHWGWPRLHCLKNLAYPMHKDGAFVLTLLKHAVIESNLLQGAFMDDLWDALSKCHPRIEKNVAYLKLHAASVEPEKTTAYIMKGVGQERIDHSHLDRLADKVLRHLIIPFMHVPHNHDHQYILPPGLIAKLQSVGCGALAATFLDETVPEILKPELLKFLLRRRDGPACIVTNCRFKFQDEPLGDGIDPQIAYLIPGVFGRKPEYMQFLQRFVSPSIYHTVQLHLNGPGNAILLQKHARLAFESFAWGIELVGVTEHDKLSWHWVYEDLRQLGEEESYSDHPSALIGLSHGDRIWFGSGKDGAKLRYGPTPSVCLLRRSVGHLIKHTRADRLVQDLKAEAESGDYMAASTLKPRDLMSITTAKLLLLI